MELPIQYWKHASSSAQESLSKRFGLYWDDNIEDWDLIVADAGWIPQFILAYHSGELNEEEKFALMEALVASFDDLARIEPLDKNPDWKKCKQILSTEYWLHINTIHYWAALDKENVEDSWAMTKYIRPIWESVKAHFQ